MSEKPCARPGCSAAAERTYCSRLCAAIVNAGKLGKGHYQRMSSIGNQHRTAHGRARLMLPHEMRLLTQGRYHEAARLLLDRGYGAGWLAGRNGVRLSSRKVSAGARVGDREAGA